MGSHVYCYFTTYDGDVAKSLYDLREKEFRAGRYDPALRAASPPTYTFEQKFPPGPSFPSPGARHASQTEAIEAAFIEGSGTGSILDIVGLSDAPEILHACHVPFDTIESLFGTKTPSHEQVLEVLVNEPGPSQAKAAAFIDAIGRGEARYFGVYKNDEVHEVFLIGLSID